jgi:acetyl esterase/lipase
MRRLLLVGLFAVLSVSLAQAADQTVLGKTFVVKNPSTPGKRKVIVKAKELGSDNTLVGNPLAGGATITVTANGASPSQQTYGLPAGTSASNAKPFWSGDAVKGFKYRDADGENGPVKSAQIKLRNGVFQIKVIVDGKHGGVAVLPPNPGTDGCMLLAIGGGDSYSAQFASGQVKNKGTSQFKVSNPTAQGSCLPAATPTPTSTPTATATPTLSLPFITPPGAAPLRYRDLVFAGATTTLNVIYGSAVNNSGQTVTLRLDIYEPTGDVVTERPAIVWIHGGSFCCGDKGSGEIVDQATTFARKGYFNVSINYRLEPGGCAGGSACVVAIQEALEDAQTAVRYLRTNQALYGIDETRIAVAGTSAGAITALNVGFTNNDPTASVGAAVSLSGAHLLTTIDSGDAPSLLFHGTADNVVPYAWATNTTNQANNAGLDCFLTSWTGAGHVPYGAHRTEIITQTTNFLYWELDLATAAQ